jgi:hypothetical protein
VVLRHPGDDPAVQWIFKQLRLAEHEVLWKSPKLSFLPKGPGAGAAGYGSIAAAAAAGAALALVSGIRALRRGPDGRFASSLGSDDSRSRAKKKTAHTV